MATSSVPNIRPNEKLDNETNIFLIAVKNSLDNLYDKAVFYASFSGLRRPSKPRLQASAATGASVKISSGPFVASAADHAQLVNDVKVLISDLNTLSNKVDEIVVLLKGQS